MKITAIMPSRNRPLGMLGVISAYQALSTGNHDITYVVILDKDDTDSINQTDLFDKVNVMIGERDRTVNARFNEACKKFPGDVYIQLCDDAYPLAFHWDAMVYALKDIPAYSWQEKNDPTNATYIAMSHKWYSAIGRFYPEYFPYWFADTWIAEVFALAFAKPIGVVNQLQVGGKRGKTHSMRDVKFWFDFFAATRVERVKEAELLARAYGFTLNMKDRQDQIKQMLEGDLYQQTQVERYEAMFGSKEPPSALYVACKEIAENHIKVAA